MMSESSNSRSNERLKVDALWLLMLVSAICYAALTSLSGWFDSSVETTERPTLVMLGFFFAAFLCYWIALFIVVRLPASRRLSQGILGSACLFRVLMLPSVPMHEIDIHRYIWDGAVLVEGVSPFRYPPQEVLQADGTTAEGDLARLAVLRESSESLADSLGQIHYGQYPSPYPLVSQAVFAGAAWVTPEGCSSFARLTIMKGLLVLFDLATLLVVIGLVKEVGMHPGWSLAYGWCPLLMKEIANGGHLDSIAIFFTTLAVWLLVKTMRGRLNSSRSGAMASGAVLALAIGAKLYPVVLMPLFAAMWLRRGGKGTFVVGVLATAAFSLVLLYPLFGARQENQAATSQPPVVDSSAGIRTFFDQWEMNDLLFMVVLENLRSQTDVEAHRKPWFVLVPDSWSQAVMRQWVTGTVWASAQIHPNESQPTEAELLAPQNLKEASFQLTHITTGGLFFLFACWLAWRAAGLDDSREWCRAAMLTLAWFWLTCPTQNPWYWCWVLPFLPFARYRTWYVVGAAAMLYYLRFWFTAHFVEPPVMGTAYDGANFFYFVIVWFEFIPVLAALGVEYFLARAASSKPPCLPTVSV